ncbi:MAG: TOBE domain-containing protein, partial [Acidimicrobiales bacterium]
APPPASLGEWACLALVSAGASHGWALVRELAPDGPIGQVWSLSRQLTYRAVEQLVAKGLLERAGHAPGRGLGKVLVAITPTGRSGLDAWLECPVAHVRDVRTEGLLKLALRERLGRDNAVFLLAQQAALAPVIDTLLGPAHATDDFADILRRETARATQRFLAAALTAVGQRRQPGAGRPIPKLSARNQLVGTVSHVTHGDILSVVRVMLGDGQTVTATITREAAVDLALAPGDPVTAIIKATEVLLAVFET